MSSALSFDEAVSALQACSGIDRGRAEAAVRATGQFSAPPVLVADPARDDSIAEKAEQAEVARLFRAHGFTVRSTSQARASKVAPGIADLFVTHTSRPIGFWWETKRQIGGKLSPAQVVFREDCERCGIPCQSGDRYDAAAYLAGLGIGEGEE